MRGSSGGSKLRELVLGLFAEIAAINQEEDAFGTSELEQAVGDIDGGEGLAGAGRHLDERTRVGAWQRTLPDCEWLVAWTFQSRASSRGGRLFRRCAKLARLRDPFRERLRPWKVEDLTAARRGIEAVGEVGDEPLDSKRNGSGRLCAGKLSGSPAAYLADCARRR